MTAVLTNMVYGLDELFLEGGIHLEGGEGDTIVLIGVRV